MQIRGLMLDSARCLENRAYYREFVTFAAARGVNLLLWHFTDDQGCTLAFESVAGIGSPHAYTKLEMQELVAFARGHGITIVPELASLGHTRYITNLPQYRHLDEVEHVFTGMCPVALETRDVLARLIAETAEVFDSPWIHVGLDEANIGHHPLTRQALETSTRAEIVASHINFMHEHVRRHGRTMLMWGDGLLGDRQVVPRISRDIIICDWQYGAAVSGASTQCFLDEGFDVVLCPALICHGQTLFPGDQLALANLRSVLCQRSRTGAGRILGAIETIWQPERYMHDALWMGVDLAAAMLRDGPEISVKDRIARFAQEFYGFVPPAEWVRACRQLYRLSPLRAEWLALLKMDVKHLPAAAQTTAQAIAWAQIADAVAACEDQIRWQQGAYSTFSLMTKLVAHLYRKAEALQGKSIAPTDVRRLLEDERRLVGEVAVVWDRERFADDPRKFVPARECFRDNNLLAVLNEGVAVSVRLLAELASTHSGADPADESLELTLHPLKVVRPLVATTPGNVTQLADTGASRSVDGYEGESLVEQD